MLELKGLQKTFAPGTVNEHTALKDIDFTLNDGDFTTVLGSNGAGKSTLFGAIDGTFWPDAGHVLLDGEDITYLPDTAEPARSVSCFRTRSRAPRPT